MLNIKNVLTVSMVVGGLVLTGCSAKQKTSEVVVSPVAVLDTNANTNANANGYYNGGAAVNNSPETVNAAAAMSEVGTVYFAFDSSEIDEQGQAVLNKQAEFLKSDPSARVQISGHTDERGSREYNMALGERRAKSAQAYLVSQGIDVSRTEAVSFGEDQPAVEGETEDAYAQNRRVELSY
ncbi:OmpA/MotB family outer membrane protein [Moraxella macacae 0408225]|uniref:Peptidoglycan-associated lipoprotein n=1 Tax=Moraxella macacae 0408225 TaxID=1230338 RepID=L2F6K8_9GAMM|nr:peptidoglycan-associated lipoprotein Pal [Moraxella macacae]ELA08704.1 OmpA/MotB family outer membrane protein [Moraxella macacae 0408225]